MGRWSNADHGRCADCRSWIGVYVPKGGDGSVVLIRHHNKAVGVRCPGSKHEPLALTDSPGTEVS